MRKRLENLYTQLLYMCGGDKKQEYHQVNQIIKKSIADFVKSCQVPSVWCYGKHTRMLMTDFIYEMKGVHFIIDEKLQQEVVTGFEIIRKEDIQKKHIDGILISSFKYRHEIKKIITEQFPDVKYLDIYDKLEQKGIILKNEYFSQLHPYGHYHRINSLQQKIRETERENAQKLYSALIFEYIVIKDFASALSYVHKAQSECDVQMFQSMRELLEELYNLEKKAAAGISEYNVLMLCIDGLRRQDILNGLMPKFAKWIRQNTRFYKNAYSVSTSTYESLIPAYEENDDLRTRYYERSVVERGKCRFINEAVSQKRNICFYTDCVPFVDSPAIQLTDQMQTVTEKIWDFLLDASEQENGLFYIHVLYESHFSYPNPYTQEALIADGTSILFDYMAVNGGSLRTDYNKQHRDALKYLDDVLTPFLELTGFRMVIYADHGNIILPKDTALFAIERTKLSHHNDLTEVPLIIRSPETLPGETEEIESIMSINRIVISLLKKQPYVPEKKTFVKVLRSEIYNPDFKYIYQTCGFEQELLAFEAFLFQNDRKFVVYADGKCELFDAGNDRQIYDIAEINAVLEQVKDKITVCEAPVL